MFSSDENLDRFDQLFAEVKNHVKLQVEYAQVALAEKLTILISAFITILLLALIGFVVLIFLTFTLAYALESVLGSLMASFGLMAFVNVLLMLFVWLNRQRLIVEPLARFLSKLFLNQ